MNKTYRSIWNEALGAWVATSELGGGPRKRARRAGVCVALLLSAVGSAYAQTKIGDNPTTINPGSVVEVESTNRGVLMPRLAVANRTTWGLNGNQPVEGMMVYNTTATGGANGLQQGMAVWKGGQWTSVDETPYLHVNSTAVGNSTLSNSGATGSNAMALGPNAGALGSNTVAVGNGAVAGDAAQPSNGTGAVAIGAGAKSRDSNNVAIGASAVADSGTSPGQSIDGITAIGGGARATGGAATALGGRAEARASLSTALGNQAIAYVSGSTALGAGAQALGIDSVAVGVSSATVVQDGVALGNTSLADRAAGSAAYVPPGANVAQTAAVNATTSTRGAVAIGNASLAYIVRLGASMDYLPTEQAQALLCTLHQEARTHYASWSDYSLSSLIGMGMRSPLDLHALKNWHLIVSSHVALLTTPKSPMKRVSLRTTAAVPETLNPVLPVVPVVPLSASFDTIH